MKKIIPAAVMTAVVMILSGCGRVVGQDKTAPTKLGDPHIKDYAELFDEKTLESCINTLREIESNHLIDAAIVTTNDLKGASPQDYAAEQFKEICGDSSYRGLLFLINNDTNEDILYKSGDIAIEPQAEKDALYIATKDIVEGNYESAVERMFSLSKVCTSHIFDTAGVFTAEQTIALEKAASEYEREISVYVIDTFDEYADFNITKAVCNNRYPDGDGIVVVLDTHGKTKFLPEENIPEKLKTSLKSEGAFSGRDKMYEFIKKLLTEKG